MKLGYLSDNQVRLLHISNRGVDLQPQFWQCLFLRLYRLIRSWGLCRFLVHCRFVIHCRCFGQRDAHRSFGQWGLWHISGLLMCEFWFTQGYVKKPATQEIKLINPTAFCLLILSVGSHEKASGVFTRQSDDSRMIIVYLAESITRKDHSRECKENPDVRSRDCWVLMPD